MTPARADSHAWVRTRAHAYLRELLDPGDADRVRQHLASCTACADEFAELERAPGDAGEAGRHVDPALLSRWQHTRDTLRGLERALVRRHLTRCAECRQDLEALGHVPTLAIVPELELPDSLTGWDDRDRDPAAEGWMRPSTSAADGEAPRTVVIRRPADWKLWLAGAWAAAATIIALTTVPHWRAAPERSSAVLDEPSRVPPTSKLAADSSREAPLQSRVGRRQGEMIERSGNLAIAMVGPPLELSEATRDGGEPPNLFLLRAGTRAVGLRIPQRIVPSGDSLQVTVTREPNGSGRSESIEAEVLRAGRTLVLSARQGSLPWGPYRLTLIGGTRGDSMRHERTIEFELREARN